MDDALTLTVLFIEDVEDDVLWVLRELRGSGLVPTWQRVQTAEELKAALENQTWDVIISDYQLPCFSTLAALAIVKSSNQDIPFIVVSDTLGEDPVVEMMRAGVHDYVMKCHLARLPESIRREVQEAQARAYRRQTESELKRTQERLQLAIAGSGVGLWDWYIQTGNLIINEQWAQMLGYHLANLAPTTIDTWSSLVHPEDLAQYYAGLENHFRGELEFYECEVRVRHRSGEWVWVLDRGKVVEWNAAGQPVRMTGTHMDITQRKRAEAALQVLVQGTAAVTGENFFPELVRHISQALEIPHVAVTEVQDAGLRLLAFWSDGQLQPNVLWPYEAIPCCSQALQAGYSYYPSNVQAHCSDSTLFAALNAQSNMSIALYNAAGEAIGTLCLISDRPLANLDWLEPLLRTFASRASAELERMQTAYALEALNTELEHRATQRAVELQASQHFSERIADTIPHILYIYDLQAQRNIYTNREISQLLGYTPEEVQVMGTPMLAKIAHPDDLPAIANHHAHLVNAAEDDILTLEYRLRDHQGNWHWFISRDVVFSRDRNNTPTHILGSTVEITDRKQTEERLRKSEARYRALMDGASDAILLADLEGNLLEVNRRAEELLGYPRAELTRMHITHIYYPPAERESIQLAFQNTVAGHLRQPLEVNVLSCHGEVIPVGITGTFIEVDGTIIVQSIFRDIRDRKAIETSLKLTQERTQATLRALPDMVFRVDREGQYLDFFASEKFAFLTNPKTAIGKTFHETLPQEIAQAHYYSLQQALKTQMVQVREQQVQINGNFYYEEVRVAPCGNDEAVFFIRDITHRRQAEIQLKTSEAQLSALFASISDSIVVYDKEGRCLKVAPCSAHLYLSPDQLLGSTFHETFPPHLADYLLGKVHECLNKQATVKADYSLQIPQKLVHLSANISPFSENAVVIVSRDISDRKAYEAQLKKTNAELARATRLKDEFLANMSHELRTPLNAILGMTEALQEDVFGPLNEQQKKSLTTIERSGRHLLELINDILDLAKIESARLELEFTDVSIRTLCDTSLSFVRQLAHKKQIHLSLQIPNSLTNRLIRVDERRICQVLINLLSNAIKFTPQRGQVTLNVQLDTTALHSDESPDGDSPYTLNISVIDTGIGIAPENLNKLFQSFVQIDSKLNRQYEGTGLGLALVKRITEMHGGRVIVESEVNQGSCFTVKLPLQALKSSITLQKLPSPNSFPIWKNGNRVLVIEDSQAAAEQIVRYLKEKNLEPIVQYSGKDVLARVLQLQPSVVVLDMQLPKQTGWEILTQLKAHPQTKATPVIVTSVLDERHRGLALGAVAYLIKPFSREQLHEVLCTLMQGTAKTSEPTTNTLLSPNEPSPLVLLVEDNEANRYSIGAYLEAKGYRLIFADNGHQAINQVQSDHPDIILMDIQMPDMDGLEATQRIRSLPDCASIPIIALTALAMPCDRDQCLAAGANVYLTKPVRLKEVVTAITTLLEGA